jgi:hypothetical protein
MGSLASLANTGVTADKTRKGNATADDDYVPSARTLS